MSAVSPQHRTLKRRALIKALAKAMRSKGCWTPTDAELETIVDRVTQHAATTDCLFQAFMNCSGGFSKPAIDLLRQCSELGVSLRLAWPRPWADSLDEWLGSRFYLSSSHIFSPPKHYFSLVSSQIGRHGIKVPNWPALVNAALQFSYREQQRPLILPGTSLSDATKQFSDRANLDSLSIHVDSQLTVELWLEDLLSRLYAGHTEDGLREFSASCTSRLVLSPPFEVRSPSALSLLPIQDRAAIAIADRVFAIHVRSGGTIAKLLASRLADHRFPTGSIFIASMLAPTSSQPDFDAWLERGAVGWLLPDSTPQLASGQLGRTLSSCRSAVRVAAGQSKACQSLVSPLSALWNSTRVAECEWPFLAHCTRGNSGPLPEESMERYIDRVWSRGSIPQCDAFSTLQQILDEQRIAANSRLARGGNAFVSFSAVPLAELLSRRQFRSHLGRWDWEPYGILIRRDVLQSLGARPVIYGDEADFKSLNENDRDYFQPRGTKSARNQLDWTSEREWRLRGDCNFRDLPRQAIMLFAATQSQAERIARHFPWPVLWQNARGRL